ncbi:MAG: hypothetical protein CVV11_19995 [Gammaproteobacteria bacterium HGW-Gammaproteobacteria-15]|nr:MAG: hypothetical protein CVV11_19995 [Gammaproteobacteria bacterium HGW-Gammaproteobacteria-15]
MSITALTLAAASQVKATSAVPLSIQPAATGWKLVNRYDTLTMRQRAGLSVAHEWHKAFGRTGDDPAFNPVQFEIYGIQETGKGPALANELRQLGLLQCHDGRYWLSPAGLNLVNAVAAEQLHADQNAAVTTVIQVQG